MNIHMNTKTLTLTAFALLALSSCGVQVPQAQQSSQFQTQAVRTDHLTWAQSLLSKTTSSNTDYVHGTPNVSWQDAAVPGSVTQSYTDCSGLFGELLKKAYNADLLSWFGKSRLSAEDVYNTIDAKKNFIKINTVTAIQAGDVIAMKYLDDDATATGHVMVVASAPTLFQNADGTPPLPNPSGLTSYEEYLVKVIDSSSSYHGSDDTRYNKTSKTAYPGTGSGFFRLYADKTNKTILGYTWSSFKTSDFYGPAVRPLVVGRVDL